MMTRETLTLKKPPQLQPTAQPMPMSEQPTASPPPEPLAGPRLTSKAIFQGHPIFEVKSFKISFTVKVGDLPPAPDMVPNKKQMPMEVVFQCNSNILKALLNQKSYRKALANDPELFAIIQGKLDGNKIIDAGIIVKPPPPPNSATLPDQVQGQEQETAKTGDSDTVVAVENEI